MTRFYCLRFGTSPPGEPGPPIYPPEQGGPVVPPGTGSPFLSVKSYVATDGQSASLGRVKLLLAFASTVIPGFSLLEIHEEDLYSLPDMYVFRNGASSSTKEGSVFLCRRYVCCTVVSARGYPRCHGVQVTVGSVCHCTTLSSIYTRYTEVSCQCTLVQEVMS
jgi:hypothetical protein